MGYTTAWLGFGSAALGDLRLAERALDATASITVATAIVNMWTNDADVVADAYQRIAARHPGRFLLGVGIGHPESIVSYQRPYQTMVAYRARSLAISAGGSCDTTAVIQGLTFGSVCSLRRRRVAVRSGSPESDHASARS